MALTDFAGTVAVITGGASGIGLATAQALRDRDANVVLADINTLGLQRAEQQLRQHAPGARGGILSISTDVTRESQVRELMRQAFETFGRIDLVVTCAGIANGGIIDTFSAEQMQTMMNINFMGTFNCVKAALPFMRQQQSGHFVFLSSAAGKLGVPFLTAYCATKWAVRGFASALRAECQATATGIGITTVYPSWVDTPMIHQEEGDAAEIMNIQALLTADQVASEILQAVAENRRDLTLAPDKDTTLALQFYRENPDKAEIMMGEAFRQRIAKVMAKQRGEGTTHETLDT